MKTTTRIGLGLSAAVLSLSLALAPAAFAQDKMGDGPLGPNPFGPGGAMDHSNPLLQSNGSKDKK